MANYHCKHCGAKNSSVQALTSSSCTRSPTKKHELYEGSEKSQYTCKHCGIKNSTIYALTAGSCTKSPTKHHEPALLDV